MSVNLDFDLPRKKFKKCDFEIQDIKEDIKNTSISESLRIGVLSTKNLRPDVFLLGTITGFSKYSIVVSLPNLITGHVRFVDTNPLINSLLAKDSNLKINEFFNAYQYVCCSLVSNCSNMISSKLFFTMNPNEIYADLGIDDLTEGMVIWGFIVTTEEFGYEMAFGIGNFKGFLIDKKKQLKVGSMLLVSVVSIHQELNIIKVCSKKKDFLKYKN